MCWNKDVSLNTFLFSGFVLLLVMYNNAYTQYKIQDLNSVWVYLFFMSFILMQLIEYFIWNNINNPVKNSLFTTLALLLLLVQPITTNMLISNMFIQRTMLTVYLLCAMPLFLFTMIKKDIHSCVSSKGHLQWNMMLDYGKSINLALVILWNIFFLFPLFYEGNTFGFLFGIITLLIMTYKYYKDGSVGSMWCWVVNLIMIYYAGYLLIYLPFYK